MIKLTFRRSAAQYIMAALGLKRPTCCICKKKMTAKNYSGTAFGVGHVCDDRECQISFKPKSWPHVNAPGSPAGRKDDEHE